MQSDDDTEFRLVTDRELTGYGEATGVVIVVTSTAPRGDVVDAHGAVMVMQADPDHWATNTLRVYHPRTLRRVPSADIRLPGRARGRAEGEHLLWINRDQRLWVDDMVVPGRYSWVRTP